MTTIVKIKRLQLHTPSGVEYCIRGAYIHAAEQPDVDIVAGSVKTDWWSVPLPPCPDCGGDLVWYEAGYVPGARRCMGARIGGTIEAPSYDHDGGCGSMFSAETVAA